MCMMDEIILNRISMNFTIYREESYGLVTGKYRARCFNIVSSTVLDW